MRDPRIRERLILAGISILTVPGGERVLYSTRNHAEHARARARRALAYRRIELTETVFRRAITVQGLLARRGRHRLPINDLIVAATAEIAGATLLHYDSDFDTIALATGQDVEWVAPRGSL